MIPQPIDPTEALSSSRPSRTKMCVLLIVARFHRRCRHTRTAIWSFSLLTWSALMAGTALPGWLCRSRRCHGGATAWLVPSPSQLQQQHGRSAASLPQSAGPVTILFDSLRCDERPEAGSCAVVALCHDALHVAIHAMVRDRHSAVAVPCWTRSVVAAAGWCRAAVARQGSCEWERCRPIAPSISVGHPGPSTPSSPLHEPPRPPAPASSASRANVDLYLSRSSYAIPTAMTTIYRSPLIV